MAVSQGRGDTPKFHKSRSARARVGAYRPLHDAECSPIADTNQYQYHYYEQEVPTTRISVSEKMTGVSHGIHTTMNRVVIHSNCTGSGTDWYVAPYTGKVYQPSHFGPRARSSAGAL
eukprot:COSAG02_NODE_879_length_16244_cov_15.397956_10_plen_117_part_00